jgi:hypothetical protein
VLGQAAILHPDHVCRYRCSWTTVAYEAAIDNDVVAFRQDELVFVAESIWSAADEVE